VEIGLLWRKWFDSPEELILWTGAGSVELESIWEAEGVAGVQGEAVVARLSLSEPFDRKWLQKLA
jgi:hypothetical protein